MYVYANVKQYSAGNASHTNILVGVSPKNKSHEGTVMPYYRRLFHLYAWLWEWRHCLNHYYDIL